MDKTHKKLIFFLAILLTFFFPFVARGQLLDLLQFLGSTVLQTYISGMLFIFFLKLVILVLSAISGLLAVAVTSSINPNFMIWSYTQPSNNPFIARGLDITQGFISIGLIMTLVWIAFATILRLEGYDTKRLFVKLVIVAILVYFAPTICGLIVDVSNIFMYYFADKLSGIGVLANNLIVAGREMLAALLTIFNPLAWPRHIAESFLLIAVQFYLVLLLLSFFLLFLFRYAAIWISVILSPIAFICWILPATKKYWNFWWDNFLKWCLAGPITAFFLYLGAVASQTIGEGLGKQILSYFTEWRYIIHVVPHLFTLGILQLGIVLGVKGAGLGSEIMLGWAQRGAGWLRGKMATYGATPQALWARARRSGESIFETVMGRERMEKMRARLQERARIESTRPLTYGGRPIEEISGLRGVLARVAVAPWAVRRKIYENILKSYEVEKQQIDEIEKKYMALSADMQLAHFRRATSDAERLGILRAIIKSGNLRDVMDTRRYGTNALTSDEVRGIYGLAEQLGRADVVRAAFPQIAVDYYQDLNQRVPGSVPIPAGIPQVPGAPNLPYYAYLLQRLRPNDIATMAPDVLQNRELVQALLLMGTPEQFRAFYDRFGPQFIGAFETALDIEAQRRGWFTPQGQPDRNRVLSVTNPQIYEYARRRRWMIPWVT
jgi:hypothetical protein